MDANEFWCRAFLAAMRGSYSEHGEWENHGSPAAYAEKAADAALAVAQRRGMVAGERASSAKPDLERVEFTAEPRGERGSGVWMLKTAMYPDGLVVVDGDTVVSLTDGNTVHIKWVETMPPKPVEMRIERPSKGETR